MSIIKPNCYILIISTLILFLLSYIENVWAEKNPKELVKEVVNNVGDYEKLKQLNDVEYTYTYKESNTGKEDVSVERYIFEGELSWAEYTKRQAIVMPDQEGKLIQGYNGKISWATLNGNLINNSQLLKLSDFIRKTNFYWFCMNQKLLDPGILYSYDGNKELNGVNYDLVRINFEEGVGDVSDTYLLYINSETKLIDQFLFTVMDFNIDNPYLMRVEYKEINGVKLPVSRTATSSNWDGDVKEDSEWIHEFMENIKFNNGFSENLFDKP